MQFENCFGREFVQLVCRLQPGQVHAVDPRKSIWEVVRTQWPGIPFSRSPDFPSPRGCTTGWREMDINQLGCMLLECLPKLLLPFLTSQIHPAGCRLRLVFNSPEIDPHRREARAHKVFHAAGAPTEYFQAKFWACQEEGPPPWARKSNSMSSNRHWIQHHRQTIRDPRRPAIVIARYSYQIDFRCKRDSRLTLCFCPLHPCPLPLQRGLDADMLSSPITTIAGIWNLHSHICTARISQMALGDRLPLATINRSLTRITCILSC